MPQQNPWAQCFFESQKGLLESSDAGWDFWEGIQQIGGLCCVGQGEKGTESCFFLWGDWCYCGEGINQGSVRNQSSLNLVTGSP